MNYLILKFMRIQYSKYISLGSVNLHDAQFYVVWMAEKEGIS